MMQPACVQCGASNAVDEGGETVCGECGLVLSLGDFAGQDFAEAGGVNVNTHAFSNNPRADRIGTAATKKNQAYALIHGLCSAANISNCADSVLQLFKQVMEQGAFRWSGDIARAVCAVCLCVVARRERIFLPLQQIMALCSVDLSTYNRYHKKVMGMLQTSGADAPAVPELEVLQHVDRFIDSIMNASRESQIMLPQSYRVPLTQATRSILAATMPSLLAGRHAEPFAVAVVFVGVESLLRHRISLLPFATYLQVSPASVTVRTREIHDLFLDMASKLPWGADVKRSNLAWFLAGMLRMVENGVTVPGIEMAPSFRASEMGRHDVWHRVQRAAWRLRNMANEAQAQQSDQQTDRLDLAIEQLLLHKVPSRQVASMSETEIASEAQRLSQDLIGRSTLPHEQGMLTAAEEAEYILDPAEVQQRATVLNAIGQIHNRLPKKLCLNEGPASTKAAAKAKPAPPQDSEDEQEQDQPLEITDADFDMSDFDDLS
ncbi:hypothetical protein RI367_006616 [Sorochytrium milnesiophthora]